MNLVELLVNFVVWGIAFYLVWWFIGFVESKIALPVPVYNIVRVLLVLFVVVWLIGVLTGGSQIAVPLIRLR